MASSPKVNRIKRFKLAYQQRRTTIFANSWGLALGWLAIFTSISYFVDPHRFLIAGALGEALRTWAWAWNVMYCLGGFGMVYGIIQRSRAIDMFGLSFMAGALLINALCVLVIRHGASGASAPALIALAIAAIMRLRILYQIGKL